SDVPWKWGETRSRIVQGSGWPLIALTGSFELDPTWTSISKAKAAFVLAAPSYGGLGPTYSESPLLPLAPTWPGFAINTMFYAATLWLLFAAVRFVCRLFIRGRIKRGLCPACAYPIGVSPMCTECGAALRPH